jgi:hypothetical protein
LMLLSGDWTTYVHLGLYRPVFDHTFEWDLELMTHGGVTLALQPSGDAAINIGMAVCSLSENYSREVGRRFSSERIFDFSMNVTGDPTYQWDPSRGCRTVELDEIIISIIGDADDDGKLSQFSRFAKRVGSPMILATRVNYHPVWTFSSRGTSGRATFER